MHSKVLSRNAPYVSLQGDLGIVLLCRTSLLTRAILAFAA